MRLDRVDSWRPEDDDHLIHLRNVERKRWAVVGSALGRSKTAAHRRYLVITKPEDRVKVTNRTWTSEAEVELHRFRFVENRTITEIMGLMKLSRDKISRKLDRMRAAVSRVHFERPRTRTIPLRVLADRDRRLLAERSLTATLFGDPAPGQSALDRRLAGVLA